MSPDDLPRIEDRPLLADPAVHGLSPFPDLRHAPPADAETARHVTFEGHLHPHVEGEGGLGDGLQHLGGAARKDREASLPGRLPPVQPLPEGSRHAPEETRRPVVGAKVHPPRDPVPRGKLVPGARPEEDLEVGSLRIERRRRREDGGEPHAAAHEPPRPVLSGKLEAVPERQGEGERIAAVEPDSSAVPRPTTLYTNSTVPFPRVPPERKIARGRGRSGSFPGHPETIANWPGTKERGSGIATSIR